MKLLISERKERKLGIKNSHNCDVLFWYFKGTFVTYSEFGFLKVSHFLLLDGFCCSWR